MQSNWISRHSDVINLCFHGIGTPARPLEPDEGQYWVEVRQFEELLRTIRKYPSIRITFDDGNASDATYALPALRAHDLEATFFVIAGRLDEPGSLARSGVSALLSSGMTIGSHGMIHRPWRSLDDAALRSELADSANVLGTLVGEPIREVSCPFGDYDRRVLAAIRKHGYARAYTVDGAAAKDHAWLQSRYTVRSHDVNLRLYCRFH